MKGISEEFWIIEIIHDVNNTHLTTDVNMDSLCLRIIESRFQRDISYRQNGVGGKTHRHEEVGLDL